MKLQNCWVVSCAIGFPWPRALRQTNNHTRAETRYLPFVDRRIRRP
jgi:hypothetical protein